MWAVCQNENYTPPGDTVAGRCPAYNWPIDIGDTSFPVVDEVTGETTWITTTVYCGRCNQEITRILDVKPDDPVEPDVEAPV